MCRGLLLLGVISGVLYGGSLDQAVKLYHGTDYQGSLAVLTGLPEKGAAVFDLMGKNYYMLGDFKKASEVYEYAVAADPANSEYENWLGRSYGRRAETASPFTAPGLASKARQHFEKAVALNPKNRDAVDDLFEYYLEAPGFLGGGLDKAAKLAEHIGELDSAEGLWAQFKIAERHKDYGKAEEQLRRAVQAAPTKVNRIVELAKFLAKRGRIEESEQTFQVAERVTPNNPRLLYHRAETYVRAGRNLDTARDLLKRYLTESLSPDDPPRSDAQKLLKQEGG